MQTDYGAGLSAMAGQIADGNPHSTITRKNTTGGDIAFGLGVCRKSGASESGDELALPAASGDVAAGIFLGPVVGSTAREPNSGNGYAANEPVPILEFGNIWLYVEGTVTEGQQLFCRYGTGAGGSQKGAFRADADTATAAAVPGLYTRQARTGAGLVLCRYTP